MVKASTLSRMSRPTVWPLVAGTVETCVTKRSVVMMVGPSGCAPRTGAPVTSRAYAVTAVPVTALALALIRAFTSCFLSSHALLLDGVSSSSFQNHRFSAATE